MRSDNGNGQESEESSLADTLQQQAERVGKGGSGKEKLKKAKQ